MIEPQPVFTAGDGRTFSVPIRKLREIERTLAQEKAHDMVEKYMTGSGTEGTSDYKPPSFIGIIDGEPAYVTFNTALVAATIERAQCCPPDDRYTFEELAMFMNEPNLSDQILAVFYKLPMERPKDPKANENSLPPNTALTEE
jgi:hypothetical protein